MSHSPRPPRFELDSAGYQTARNVYGLNLISREVGADTLTYMYNGHADVTALLDNSSVVATYYYDAFGNVTDQTGSANNCILYAGYQYDPQTGLYYLNARMYDPVTARFLQEDTVRGRDKDPLSLNLYTYCHNEPLMYSDPTGHRTTADDGTGLAEYTDDNGTQHYIASSSQEDQRAKPNKARNKGTVHLLLKCLMKFRLSLRHSCQANFSPSMFFKWKMWIPICPTPRITTEAMSQITLP